LVFALTGKAVFPFYDLAEKHLYLSSFHCFKVNGHKIRLSAFLVRCNFFSTIHGYWPHKNLFDIFLFRTEKTMHMPKNKGCNYN